MIELDKSFPRIAGLRHLDLFPETEDRPAAVIMLFIRVKKMSTIFFLQSVAKIFVPIRGR